MKIIANSCVGGYLYRDYCRCNYQTPFIWNLIDFKSMYNLISNFRNLNFKDYDIKKDRNWNFSIIIEKVIEVKYIHYKFDPHANNVIHKGIDVYSNKIWEYIAEKYEKRVERMVNNTSTPIFILANGWNPPETILKYNHLKMLNDLNQNNIICGVDKVYPEFYNLTQTLRYTGPIQYGANMRLAKKIYNDVIKPKLHC